MNAGALAVHVPTSAHVCSGLHSTKHDVHADSQRNCECQRNQVTIAVYAKSRGEKYQGLYQNRAGYSSLSSARSWFFNVGQSWANGFQFLNKGKILENFYFNVCFLDTVTNTQ